jgi:hypothetical protein
MGRKSMNGQSENITSQRLTLPEKPHLQTLLKHKHIYDMYMKTQELVGFAPHIRNEVVNAYKVEHPHYDYNANCHICVCEMLVTIYKWYNTQL